ncbi:MAG: CBS domain-containing protein [Anaerolineae bacterium]
MRTVKQLLQIKGSDVWSIGPAASVYKALKLMAEKNIGALVILDNGRLAGIFSERDYVRAVARNRQVSLETPVREFMTPRVICVHCEQTIEECMVLMTEKRIRHLPVLEGEGLVGVISIGDVVKTVISEQEFIIEQLENYIVGS